MELLLAGECSTDEPFVRVGACGQAQHPNSQVSIQVGTRSPPQTAGSHLCSLESSVCTGGRVHSCLEWSRVPFSQCRHQVQGPLEPADHIARGGDDGCISHDAV